MNSKLNRRDFLKLAGAVPLGVSATRLEQSLRLQTEPRKNVIVIVFDAWSASNVPFYGYSRNTTPRISKLAERATVYHNHYAGSNYTPSGTATLLTGTYAWKNRAFEPASVIAEEFAGRSLFSIFKDYRRVAYSHNEWANILLDAMADDIEELIPRMELYLRSSDAIPQALFKNDKDVSTVNWVRNMKIRQEGFAYSLFLSRIVSAFDYRNNEKYLARFPRGLPSGLKDGGFILEDAIDWIAARAAAAGEPFCGYFHLLPPHGPYNTPGKFMAKFRHDDYQGQPKPDHLFAEGISSDLLIRRQYYDEYILYVDSEFDRLFNLLEASGALANSWVILTSDHGESFERGISGHSTKALFQPLVRIPLLIFEPGNSTRRDVYAPTSATDILPTLAYLNGLPLPNWTEGQILPPYGQHAENRSIYSVYSKYTGTDQPMEHGSVTLVKGRYKLHYYFGYSEFSGQDYVLLYDIQSDPEEMNDLSASQSDVLEEMLREVKLKIAEVNQPYL